MTNPTKRLANDERTTEAIIQAVSTATGADPLDLPPLYDALDPDAIDRLIPCDDQDRRFDGWIEFAYAGCEVQVYADGRVVVVTSESERESRTALTG